MPKYAAFLRAINVGGHTVTMQRLREPFEELGLQNVETFIASGNVIFDTTVRSAAPLEKKIAAALGRALGYEVATFLRTIPAVTDIAGRASSREAEGVTVYVGFLESVPSAVARRSLASLGTALDELVIEDRELYWLRRGLFSESKLSGAMLEKALGMPTTLRNANTIRRIAAKYAKG